NILLFLTDENKINIKQTITPHIFSAFLAGGIIQMLRFWLTNPDNVSEEKLCSEFEKILSSVSVP
ncbi:MAG: hypothetical protein Q4D32_02820, partial [Eubacteriales bacterium]|nr:hypothetical protein [Eubacteriales bacterium]